MAGKTLTIQVCVQNLRLYIIFEAISAEKNDWTILDSKVDQRVPIGMILELDVWRRLLYICTKFQIDIS